MSPIEYSIDIHKIWLSMRPSVRQLEYLVAVADALHFGRAARACAVTQPALSAQLRALEEQLGVRLFERSRRGVRATGAGARVILRTRAALRALDEVVAAAAALREPLSGPLQLGVIPTIAPYLLPRWLPRVRRAYPALELYLHEDRTARLLRRLREGELDLALLALPVEGHDLESLPLFEEPFLLAAPRAHPLARARRPVAESELAGEVVLLLEDGHCLREQALSVCRHAGAREAEQVRASSLGTLVQMVANGLGLTLIPASAVPVETRGQRDLAVRAFAPPAPSRRVGLVWRAGSARAAELRQLGALLREARPRPRRASAARRAASASAPPAARRPPKRSAR
jgi:LysR family hydrogen peroxide-inducible transcriptional activator